MVKKLIFTMFYCFLSFPVFARHMFVDISKACNMGFADEIEGDRKGGWTDQGAENDLSAFPLEQRIFAGVEFKIIDPKTNNGKSCMMFKGTERDYFFEKAEIKVEKKANFIYVLHSSAWTPKKGIAGKININYSDKTDKIIPVSTEKDVGEWWGADELENGKIGWFGPNKGGTYVGVFVSKFRNPCPEKLIDSFVLQSGEAEWGVIAVTLSNKDVKLKSVTQNISYAGKEPDAPWRKAAEERIDKIRKSDLVVKVTDKNGSPVKNAGIDIKMTRSAFGFGTAVVAGMLLDNNPADAEKYREVLKELFNKVVFENDLKWPQWERDRETPLKAINWLQENNFPIRGHNLIWPSWRYTPADVKTLKDNPVVLKKRISGHIAEEATVLKGKLVEWDVQNEPYTENDILKILGEDISVEWYKQVRSVDPDVKLYINDFGNMEDTNKAQTDNYERYIDNLVKKGAPLDGIGLQGHFGAHLVTPERLLEILDRFAKFGLPMQVTEFDIAIGRSITNREEIYAEYMRDFMTVLFSYPSIDSILLWGFWEGRHWIPDAALFRRDWSIKPSGEMWKYLVLEKWRTKAKGKTDDKGGYSVRGFFGDYDIKVESKGKVKSVKTTLTRDGGKIDIRLE